MTATDTIKYMNEAINELAKDPEIYCGAIEQARAFVDSLTPLISRLNIGEPIVYGTYTKGIVIDWSGAWNEIGIQFGEQACNYFIRVGDKIDMKENIDFRKETPENLIDAILKF